MCLGLVPASFSQAVRCTTPGNSVHMEDNEMALELCNPLALPLLSAASGSLTALPAAGAECGALGMEEGWSLSPVQAW